MCVLLLQIFTLMFKFQVVKRGFSQNEVQKFEIIC